MKTSSYFCTAILAFFNMGNSFGQITILSSDYTEMGDEIVRYTDTIPGYGPGGSGADQTWDFSVAVNHETATTNVVSVGSTPYASSFGSSDYAMTGAADSYLFFTHNNVYMGTNGAAGDLLETGEIIEAPFTDPLVLHTFPRTYNSRFEDIYGFTAEADGSAFDVYRIRLTHSGIVYDTTDAYGTLITPTGTYDALRVKTVDYTTDVIEVVLTPPLFPGLPLIWIPFTTVQDTTVSYSWHAKEQMLAIAEFSLDSIGNPARFTYSSVPPVNTVGIDETTKLNSLVVYPQPATEQVCLKGLEENKVYQAEIFATNGKRVRRSTMNGSCLNVANLSSGMYLLSLSSKEGIYRETLKFVLR